MDRIRIATAFFALLCSGVHAAPACVNPAAKNIVLAMASGNLADGWGGELWLQNVASGDRILMRRCSGKNGDRCYFANDATPGRYYFQEVLPGAKNGLYYPVSKPALWFDITGIGVDYIGDWEIHRRENRGIEKLSIKYELKHLDTMIQLCEIQGRRLFLDKTREKPTEIVD